MLTPREAQHLITLDHLEAENDPQKLLAVRTSGPGEVQVWCGYQSIDHGFPDGISLSWVHQWYWLVQRLAVIGLKTKLHSIICNGGQLGSDWIPGL